MNEWSKKTIELAKTQNYLDRLQQVYPQEDGDRDVSQEVIQSIISSFKKGDETGLLNELLDLEKFPYKDSYVSFLRKDRDAIRRNPATVKRIVGRLYEMGIDEIVEKIQQPKEANQRRGTQFRSWSFKKFPLKNLTAFKDSKKGIVLLDASEDKATNFCQTELKIAVTKRPDLVAKVDNEYIVGESKFSSDDGGNQNTAFDNGLALINNTSGKAHKVFLLDGVVWIAKSGSKITSITHSTANIFSAILLEDYFLSLQK